MPWSKIELPPVYATPPAERVTPQSPDMLQQALHSPFNTDTLAVLLGAAQNWNTLSRDEVQAQAPDNPDALAFISLRKDPKTVNVSQDYIDQSNLGDMQRTLTHELAHVRSNAIGSLVGSRLDPALYKLRQELEQDWLTKGVDRTPEGYKLRAGVDQRINSAEEHFAYTIEQAMDFVRKSRNYKPDVFMEIVKAGEAKYPGVTRAVEYIRNQLSSSSGQPK